MTIPGEEQWRAWDPRWRQRGVPPAWMVSLPLFRARLRSAKEDPARQLVLLLIGRHFWNGNPDTRRAVISYAASVQSSGNQMCRWAMDEIRFHNAQAAVRPAPNLEGRARAS